VLERKAGAARIYVNGVRVAEEENFLFSYNIKSPTSAIRRAMIRERTNVGRSAYSDRVESMLLDCKTTEIAVMGPDGAINIIFCKEIADAKNKEKKRAELVKEHRDKFANPYVAAGLGYIDQVIFSRETRPLICRGLDMLASKRQSRPLKKHGNIPL
jgi:hypothetical protein